MCINSVIVLDLGTSGFKCGVVTKNEEVVGSNVAEFKLFRDKDNYCESDFNECWNAAQIVLEKAFQEASLWGIKVNAVLITSQAKTFVPVDDDFNPLCRGNVWLDRRAQEEAEELNRLLPDFPKQSGYARVSPYLYAPKILWYKKNRPEVFSKAVAFPQIDHFIGHHLTGKYFADSTNFGMSGMYDIRTERVRPELLQAMGLNETFFPKTRKACILPYPLKPELAAKFGLEKPIPVFYCGNDQSASAAGAGVKGEGDISVNFGTALVVYACLNKYPEKILDDQIAGVCPLNANYFLLSYDSNSGNVIQNIKQELFPELSYTDFLQRYRLVEGREFPEGFSIHNEKVSYGSAVGPDEKAGFVIKHFLCRFQHHLAQMQEWVKPTQIFVSGGLAKDRIWLEYIQEKCGLPMLCQNKRDAGLVGAARIYRQIAGV